MYRNLKFLHMTDFFSTDTVLVSVTNIRYDHHLDFYQDTRLHEPLPSSISPHTDSPGHHVDDSDQPIIIYIFTIIMILLLLLVLIIIIVIIVLIILKELEK